MSEVAGFVTASTRRAGSRSSTVSVIVPEWAHTTFDNGGVSATDVPTMYSWRIWDGRFAEVRPVERILEATETL
jgi:hypothetical protein